MERGGFRGHRKNIIPDNNTSGNTSSNIQAMSSSANNGEVAAAAAETECTVREQDRFMPIANVIRIMRRILPAHAKISDDAKETIQECVSEYISFITGEANERCQREQRKTITAEDVLWAMSKLGFDDYIEPLTLFLHRHRDAEGDRGSPVPTGSASAAAPSAAFYRRGIDYGAGAQMPYGAYYGPGNMSNSNGYYTGYGGPPPGNMSSGGGASGSHSTTATHHLHHRGLNGGDQNSQLFK